MKDIYTNQIEATTSAKRRGNRGYTLAQVHLAIDEIYTTTKDGYCGGMCDLGALKKKIARALRKRGVLWFNRSNKRPEWRWMPTMPPTRELTRNILNDIREERRSEYLGRVKQVADNKSGSAEHGIVVQPVALPVGSDSETDKKAESVETTMPRLSNTKAYEGTIVSSEHIPNELINKLGDKFLVAILRSRGYRVTCTKTIEL